MADRNLDKYYRGGRFSTREGMILEIPPSGFDWSSVVPPVIDPFTKNSLTQEFPLGTKLIYGERWFRYTRMGGVASVAGNVLQAAAPVAGHTTKALDIPVVGATSVNFTPTATAITANEYQDGFFVQDAGATGIGYAYKIKSHPASAGTVAIDIALVDPIVVAIPAAGTGSLVQSPWGEPIQAVITTRTAPAVGVAQSVITAAYYGWLLTHGPASVLTAGVVVVGDNVISPVGAAGAIGPETTPLVVKATVVGRVMVVGATGTWSTIFVTIE